MCKVAVRLWLQTFNGLEALLGLTITGYGAYFAVKAPSPFSNVIAISGGVMLLVALLGLCAVRGRRGICLSLYTLLLVVLAIAHFVLLILCFTQKQKILDWIKDNISDPQRAKDTEDYVNTHLNILAYILLGVFIVEVINIAMACFARASILEVNEEYNVERGRLYSDRTSNTERENLLDGRPKPQTEAQKQREALREKYGLFKKKDNSMELA